MPENRDIIGLVNEMKEAFNEWEQERNQWTTATPDGEKEWHYAVIGRASVSAFPILAQAFLEAVDRIEYLEKTYVKQDYFPPQS